MYEDIYKEELRISIEKNIRKVKELLLNDDKGLLLKIDNFSKKYLIEKDYIKKQILNSEPISLAQFAKNPTKQNFFEGIASNFIRNIRGVFDFEKLPNNKLYVCDGSLIEKKDLQLYPKAKTIDFSWRFKNLYIYCSHKYTKDSGGAQDNQYKDLQDFISQCRDNKKRNKVFIVVADGEYYQKQNGRVGVKKIDNLARMCTDSVKVCTIYELENVLNSLK